MQQCRRGFEIRCTVATLRSNPLTKHNAYKHQEHTNTSEILPAQHNTRHTTNITSITYTNPRQNSPTTRTHTTPKCVYNFPVPTRHPHTKVKGISFKTQRKSQINKTRKIRKSTFSHQSEHFRFQRQTPIGLPKPSRHKHQENVSKYNFLSQHQVDVNHAVPTSLHNCGLPYCLM